MALPTTEHAHPAPQGKPTPGVGLQGAPPKVDPLPPAEPMLLEDIDPVLLIRLYPHAQSADELRSLALAAGAEVREAGLHIMASQQEPIRLTGTDEMLPSPMPPRDASGAPEKPPGAPTPPPQQPPSKEAHGPDHSPPHK